MAEENGQQQGNAAGGGANGANVIVIKKKNRGGGHGHHGGAWKVAYADFVTAMMAFFLLLWLLATTTEEQKTGIAHYFNPPSNSTEYGGGAGILSGESPVASDAHANKDQTPVPPESPTQEDLAIMVREDAMFRQVSENITKAMMNVPQLKALLDSILVDITPEGLRIQIVDKTGRPLFIGSTAEPYPYTKEMLSVITEVLAQLPNKLAIGGHTDAVPFRGASPAYTNWELSADRAQMARRVMVEEGIPDTRMRRVAGYADRELLLVDHPADIKNNRLSIIVLRGKAGAVASFSQRGLIAPEAGPIVDTGNGMLEGQRVGP